MKKKYWGGCKSSFIGRVKVSPPKIVKNLPWTHETLIAKENHIGSAVSMSFAKEKKSLYDKRYGYINVKWFNLI